MLGSWSKPRRERQRERHQEKGLISKTIAAHVRYKSLYISLPSYAKQQDGGLLQKSTSKLGRGVVVKAGELLERGGLHVFTVYQLSARHKAFFLCRGNRFLFTDNTSQGNIAWWIIGYRRNLSSCCILWIFFCLVPTEGSMHRLGFLVLWSGEISIYVWKESIKTKRNSWGAAIW